MQAALQQSPVAPIPPPPALRNLPDSTPYQRHPEHMRSLRRIGVRKSPDKNDLLMARCVDWLFPWTIKAYPGLYRGILPILTIQVTRRAIDHWRVGTRPLPAWAAADLANHMQE